MNNEKDPRIVAIAWLRALYIVVRGATEEDALVAARRKVDSTALCQPDDVRDSINMWAKYEPELSMNNPQMIEVGKLATEFQSRA